MNLSVGFISSLETLASYTKTYYEPKAPAIVVIHNPKIHDDKNGQVSCFIRDANDITSESKKFNKPHFLAMDFSPKGSELFKQLNVRHGDVVLITKLYRKTDKET